MNYLWLIFELLVNLTYGFVWCVFIVKYFGFKKNIKSRLLIMIIFSVILFAIISVFNYIVIYEGFLSIIYILSIFIFSHFMLKGKTWEKFLISVMQQLSLVGISFVVPMSLNLLFEHEMMNTIVMEFSIFRLILIILILAVYLLILKLILYLKKEFHDMKKSQWLIIISIPIISLILIISIMEIILMAITEKPYHIFLVAAVGAIIILNVLIYLFMGILNKNNKLLLKYQLEAQQRLYEEKNIDNIKNMYDKIRVLKHDMKHHNDYITSKIINIPKINDTQRKYISEILSYVIVITENIDSIRSTLYTENKIIDSLLNYKIGLAIEKNIKIETIVDKNIPEISDIDLCCVLGNLLDNAIEACENEKVEDKIIILHITVKNSCLLICVKNSIEESIIDKNPNFNTMKQNREIHGMGLKSIRSIAAKYSGYLKISEQEKKFFITEVLLVGGQI